MRTFLLSSLAFIMISVNGVFLMPVQVMAAIDPVCNKSGGFLGLPTWYKYVDVVKDPNAAGCKVVLPKEQDDRTDIGASASRILLAVFEIMLRIAGLLAIAFIMWGGIQYQLSQGEPDGVNKARTTILNAVIGLALAISATVIVNLVARNIT